MYVQYFQFVRYQRSVQNPSMVSILWPLVVKFQPEMICRKLLMFWDSHKMKRTVCTSALVLSSTWERWSSNRDLGKNRLKLTAPLVSFLCPGTKFPDQCSLSWLLPCYFLMFFVLLVHLILILMKKCYVFIEAERVAFLLGVNAGDLLKALLKPKIKVGTEVVTQGRNKDQVS